MADNSSTLDFILGCAHSALGSTYTTFAITNESNDLYYIAAFGFFVAAFASFGVYYSKRKNRAVE